MNKKDKNNSEIENIFCDKIVYEVDPKLEYYNELNWSSKLFFEDKIIRNTTCTIDMDAKTSKNELYMYKEQINDLYYKNLLFFIEILYKYGSSNFVIYNSNHYLDEDIPFLEKLYFKIKDTNEKFDSDICIGIINEPEICLGMFIDDDYHNNIATRPIHTIMCNNYGRYMALPDVYFLRSNRKNVDKYVNIKFQFNEYGFLEFYDDYQKYIDKFFMFDIREINST